MVVLGLLVVGRLWVVVFRWQGLWICGFDLGWFFFPLSYCELVAGGGGGGCLYCDGGGGGGGGDILFYCSKNIIILL